MNGVIVLAWILLIVGIATLGGSLVWATSLRFARKLR